MLENIKSHDQNFNRIICILLTITMVVSLVYFAADPVFANSDNDGAGDIVEYKITLNSMGGSVSPLSITVVSGDAFGDLPVPVKENCDFKGWYTDPYEGEEITSGAIVMPPVPETLYARWANREFKVTLDPARADLEQTEYTAVYGSDFSFLPLPERKGLVFMGWYTKKSGGKRVNSYSKVNLTGDITLYAKWAPVWYLQTDKKWSKRWYRVRRENSTIGNAGCGPTTMAMVVASLKNTKVTPVNACKWSKKKRYKAYLSGTKDGFFKAYGKKYKIKVKQTSYGDLRYTKKKKAKKYHNQAKKAVKNGNWVIVLAGKGKWTRGSGHFILWYKTEGEYAMIRDSNSKNSGRAKAKVSTLQKQVKRYWIITVPKDKKVN